MPERDEHESLKDLDERLRRLRQQETPERPGSPGRTDSGKGLGFALRIGVELVAALIVGVGIGIFLDSWLGTAPWLLIVFFVLGAAAGLMNVYRVMTGMDQAVGYRDRGKDRPDNTDA